MEYWSIGLSLAKVFRNYGQLETRNTKHETT